MSREILTSTQAVLFLIAFTACANAAALSKCSGAESDDGIQIGDAQKSPFYAAMQKRMGVALSCRIAEGGAGREITVSFQGGGILVYAANEAIETSRQEVFWPKAEMPPSTNEAIELLRTVEMKTVGPNGCGIPWWKDSTRVWAPNADKVFAGTVCSCHAHLNLQNGRVRALGFALAC